MNQRETGGQIGDALYFLATAGEVLSSSLDYETTLTQIAWLAVPHLADWCIVDILQDDGTLKRLAMAHADPQYEAEARAYLDKYPPLPDTPAGIYQAVRTGQSILVTELTDEMLRRAARDEEQLDLLHRAKVRSLMYVPMAARGRTLGGLSLLASDPRRLGQQDLALAEELARRAAVAIDNAQLYREANEALTLRDQFLSLAAHELRTPLTALLLQTQLLQRLAIRDTGRERVLQLADGIVDQAHHLTRLINELLDVSYIEEGRLELGLQDTDLAAVVRGIAGRHIEAGRRIEVRETGNTRGRWDPTRLEQVIQILLENAIKFGRDEPIEVTISGDESAVRIAVRDRGRGIAPGDRDRIWERFGRIPSPENPNGLGLGLHISRRIVEAHGGWIELASVPEQGSTFTVVLPRSSGLGT